MAAVSGNSGVLQTGASGAEVAIASLTTWSLELSADTIDITAMTDASHIFKMGQYTWSGSADAHWNDDDATQEGIQTSILGTDNAAVIKLYPVGTSAGDYYSGSIMMTSMSISGSLNSPVAFSFSFQGSGVLTRTNA